MMNDAPAPVGHRTGQVFSSLLGWPGLVAKGDELWPHVTERHQRHSECLQGLITQDGGSGETRISIPCWNRAGVDGTQFCSEYWIIFLSWPDFQAMLCSHRHFCVSLGAFPMGKHKGRTLCTCSSPGRHVTGRTLTSLLECGVWTTEYLYVTRISPQFLVKRQKWKPPQVRAGCGMMGGICKSVNPQMKHLLPSFCIPKDYFSCKLSRKLGQGTVVLKLWEGSLKTK
jgi:hypothetical protein